MRVMPAEVELDLAYAVLGVPLPRLATHAHAVPPVRHRKKAELASPRLDKGVGAARLVTF